MRIGDNLSPKLQAAVVVLWIIGYGLMFLAAISVLWEWRVVSVVSCIGLIAFVIDERKGIRSSLSSVGRLPDRLLSIYLLILVTLSTIINGIFFGYYLTR